MSKKQKVMQLNIRLDRQQRVAFICSPRLGDTLISLVTVNNLVRNGCLVTVYGDYAYALRDWFPWVKIYPALDVEMQQELKKYYCILHMYDSELSNQVKKWHRNSTVLADSILYLAKMSMVDIQVALCKAELNLDDIVRENNIKPQANLVQHKYKKRVVIHPTSGESFRTWPQSKFIILAKRLQKQAYKPYFVVAPSEKSSWEFVTAEGLGLFSSEFLGATASFIYESGCFIGNDSGIGHLASNLNIPTLSLIMRPGLARQWHPSWGKGEVVMPPWWLNPRPIKEKLWKYFVSVNRVLSGFDKLIVGTDPHVCPEDRGQKKSIL